MAASSSSSKVSSESCVVVGRKPQKEYEGTMQKYDRGIICDECDVDSYAAFLGIPYATIPRKSKRFQAPESLGPSDDTPSTSKSTSTYKANVTGKLCIQLDEWTTTGIRSYHGSEDCLYLNVFIPKKPELIEELLPVLVYIHGGGFMFGSNDHEEYTPDSIIQHGVVFVTMNYRLGVLGFLNMHTKGCPGNIGLKDQVKALEWIRDNIECFKGDPNNVTLSGCSAGATCVNLHLISPMSKNLFHKAIIQSGGVYSTWGYRGHRREQKRSLVWHSGFRDLSLSETNTDELQDCVCSVLWVDRQLRHPQSFAPYFGPSVEKFKEEAFIPEDIEEMMKKVDHDKPIMAGITKAEGLHCFIVCSADLNRTSLINDDIKFHQLLMDNFRWPANVASKLLGTIRNKYFPQRFSSSEQNKELQFANFIRDIYLCRFYNNFKFGPERTMHSNLYVYQFEHFSEICQMWGVDPFNEPTHGDDLRYLYPSLWLKKIYGKYIYKGGPYYNPEIREVMSHMESLWANFCKTGIPKSNFDRRKVEWRRHSQEAPCYLRISKNLELKEESLFQNEWNWLNELINSHPTVKSLEVTPSPD